ncbi:5-carboxymethyl-2-hydroxymuconate Delta-isomerase [Streptomyces anulatus]|uniref:Isomerase n=1 Tax=Streptomyces anulatus TaxID=1892 RepID=A0A6G3SIB6_STRAQ|nr:isomerase [Streptomyces anulatus]NDZ60857.1 isomerase [Streptomyces anulatus]NEB82649.1 isomerase [Streptomyces anulatus]NEC00154.1 isomerase [Streptomyces anulatus]NED24128.1 isomerase [Streptomyces anulatus]
MPQITVDYSGTLAESFDRQAFALALHPLVVTTVNARPEACKTRFRKVEDFVIGAETEGHAVLHIEIRLLHGRPDETKIRLANAVLALIAAQVEPADGVTLHSSVEIPDLDVTFRKR